jgi:dTDP-4-amino-4,6-dideoxy-D-galactose acyltransferase
MILDPCELLEWDSDFFGFRIARVRGNVLTGETVQQIDAWCYQNDIRCLYFLSRADEPATSQLAEENGLRLVDVRMTFEYDMTRSRFNTPDLPTIIRSFQPEDVDILQIIVRDSYRDTRFYFDVNFPTHMSDLMYETWFKRSCEGYAQAVFVSELVGLPVGYITCHIDEEQRIGKIGLIGVGRRAQGRGIGQTLVVSAVDWILSQGAQRVEVVTQGRNCVAQRLYQRCGFLTKDVQLWFHKWYLPVASDE